MTRKKARPWKQAREGEAATLLKVILKERLARELAEVTAALKKAEIEGDDYREQSARRPPLVREPVWLGQRPQIGEEYLGRP